MKKVSRAASSRSSLKINIRPIKEQFFIRALADVGHLMLDRWMGKAILHKPLAQLSRTITQQLS
jgi:hypothetical protein